MPKEVIKQINFGVPSEVEDPKKSTRSTFWNFSEGTFGQVTEIFYFKRIKIERRWGCGGIGRAAQRGADPVHPVRRCKVPLVRPPRAPGSAPPTRAAPEPISLPLARPTPPQRHDRMARAHGACGARTLRHGWVLDFNGRLVRVRDKVAAAECRRALLKCEIAQIGLCARAPAAPVRSARVGR